MFNKFASLLAAALVASRGAFAVPVSNEARAPAASIVQFFYDPNFQTADLQVQIEDGVCFDLTGGFGFWDQHIGSAIVPPGVFCTVYVGLGCVAGGGISNSLPLGPGRYPDTTAWGGSISSFSCSIA